ncbi:2-(3-amino-3-carboxypropyl)histidine synthase subunit 2-like [Argiope bruennichi]|uniref:2-(3-amino-3-carboxypropyl)histidine synthase subunit 2-like n=1 Tax=Argiope bruennichi TaxID=94029 RepID=UPI0024950ADC|nr:2-(3-amino-3-carboxypropyl)histidine synthase subunit 2-like [Argiope bruennichi]
MATGMKRKRVVLSLKQKLEIVNRLDKGEKLTALAKEYNVGKSSVLDIKMRKDSLLKYVSSFANAENMNMRKTMKTSYNKELDQAVFEWYLTHTKKGKILSGPDICNKALEINKMLGGSSDFKASYGWLKNFKYRHGIMPVSGNALDLQVDGNYSAEHFTQSSSDNICNTSFASNDTTVEAWPRKKRKHVMLSLKDKLDIITRLHKGEMAANLAREYNIGKSTVNDIKTKQDALLNYVSSFPNCDNIHQRKTMKSACNKDLDRAVYKWYSDCIEHGNFVSGPAICDKALELNKEFGGDPEFKASVGWLQNFKTRHGLHLSINDNGNEKINSFNPPDIYLEEDDANSSECDSVHSSQNNICFPNCDVILDVPDESSISYSNDKEISCNDTFEQASDSNELLLAFKTIIDWTEKQKECSSVDVINLLKLHELAYVKGMAVAFSSDDSEAINRRVDIANDERRSESISVEEMYEIDKCVKWIKDHDFSKIALQFPDSMLGDAMTVSLTLGEMTGKQVFVLGDTSYGSCCVDEISAEHVLADAIIHFGHSCLSPTKRLPVLYVFGKKDIDIEDVTNAFEKIFSDKKSSVILLYEVMYSYAIDTLTDRLKEYDNLVVSRLEIPGENSTISSDSEVNGKAVITKLHRHFLIPSELSLNDYKVFYVGSRPVTLTNFMLTLKNCLFYSYNPVLKLAQVETLDVNKHLKRRYYYIEKAKDANIIGILVGTVGVSEYMSIIKHLKELIKQAGKKSYTLVVGKLNSAKLANFAEIEIFVNIACVESSLIESRDFYQPIITPYELEIALNQARKWTGDYIADFAELLPGAASYIPSEKNTEIESDVSLVTGKIRRIGAPTSNEVNDDSATSLVTRNDMKLSAIHSNAAGEFLTQKSWKGLEQHLGETPVAEIEEGQKGIASKYEDEKL